jgi:predicted lipid-binding transport protein (Tim44 family)
MGVVQRTAPLRLAGTPDRVTVLAAAISGVAADPRSAEAGRRLDEAVAGCTGEEYEAAWGLASGEAPAEPEPEPEPATASAAAPPAATPRLRRLPWRSLDGGAAIRLTAAVSVLGVAAIAAVVSYTHIYDLAVAHHESGTAARLLPVSVDGLIVSASMTLLDAARKRLDAPPVAYLMLWLGVGATVAANVAFGLPYGRLAAVVAAWPAVSFVGSVEMALTLARNQRRVRGDDGAGRPWRPRRRRKTAIPDQGMADEPSAVTAPEPVKGSSATAPAKPPALRRAPRQAPAAKRTAASAKAAKADAAITANPSKTNAEIAKIAGVSERTVERRRGAARKTANP